MKKDLPEKVKKELLEKTDTPVSDGKVGFAPWVKKRAEDPNDTYYVNEDSDTL